MTLVARTDRSTITKRQRTDAGYLRVDAKLTRTGVLEYVGADGSITRELRHPDDVFAKQSLDSLKLVPVTDGHPPDGIDAKSARQHSRGVVADDVRQDGRFVASSVMLHDEELIAKADTGDAQELSCGYRCLLTDESGEYEGQRYDARQTQIRYNHVAVVPLGRAGSEVRLRMDGADSRVSKDSASAESSATIDTKKVTKMKVKIGSRDVEIADQATADAVVAAVKARDDEHTAVLETTQALVKSNKSDSGAEKARADALEAKLKQVQDSVPELVKERVALEQVAYEVLGEDAKLPAAAVEVQKLVLKELAPNLKIDKYDAAQIAIAYQTTLDLHDSDTDESFVETRRQQEGRENDKADKSDKNMTAREKMMAGQQKRANAKKEA